MSEKEEKDLPFVAGEIPESKQQSKEDYPRFDKVIKERVEEEKFTLSNLESTLINSFHKKRMIFERLLIVVNQGLIQLGYEKVPKEEIEKALARLVEIGFLEREEIPYENRVNIVYILTDEGKQRAI